MSLQSNGSHKCYSQADGEELASGNFAMCALFDKFCSKLTILSGQCAGEYPMINRNTWSSNDIIIDDDTTLVESHRMALKCRTGGNTYYLRHYHEYICENEYIPSGVRYGMNKINGENVYVVGNSRIHVNGMHRMFEVQTPADGSSVYVYPIVAPWGSDSSVVKVTPKSDPAIPAVAVIDLVRDGAFRVQMVSGSCDATPGATSMSVMQIKRGHFYDAWAASENVFAAYREVTGEATMSYDDHEFSSRPLAFAQLQNITAGPASKYIYTRITGVTASSMSLRLEGVVDTTYGGGVGYIAMHFEHANVSKVLFGNLTYKFQLGGASFDHDHGKNTFVQDISAYGLIEQPLVFHDTDYESSNPVYGVVESASKDSVWYGYTVDNCGDDSHLSDGVGYNVFVIGRAFEDQLGGWSANRDGCPHLKSFRDCAGDYFPVDNNTAFATNLEATRTVAFDSQKFYCCDIGTANATTGRCSPYVYRGHAMGQCVLESHCDKLEVHDSGDYDGVYDQVDRWAYKKDSDGHLMLRVSNYDRAHAYYVRKSDNETMKTFYSGNINCLVERHDSDGRVVNGPSTAYKVGDALSEGPGDARQVNTEDRFVSDLVYYKYFQMEVSAMDAENGLYTYVGGTTWNGEAVAFGSLHLRSSTAVGLSFDNVTPAALIVKPLIPSCAGEFSKEKVNVFLMKPGTFSSQDGSTVLHAQVANVSVSARIEFPEDPYLVPAVFTA
eukprot:Lankesteria_metandrocarpae@DN5489_c3_g4_i1.p1